MEFWQAMEFWLTKALGIVMAPSHLLLLLLALVFFVPGFRLLRDGLGTFIVFLLLTATLLPVGDWALLPLERCAATLARTPFKADGVIVLGGMLDEDATTARNEAAFGGSADRFIAMLKLARAYPGAPVIFTGGSAWGNPGFHEGEILRRAAESLGVDARRISAETRARNTIGNVKYTKDAFTRASGKNWLIVTSAYHMPRALSLFEAAGRKSGTHFYAYPTDYRTRGQFRFKPRLDPTGNLSKLDHAVKEYAGLAVNRLLGRTDSLMTCTPPKEEKLK